jgi:hypothetical protein
MSRLSWVAPLYGYLVCVIGVVTFLINASGFIDATFDRMNPLVGRGSYGPYAGSLTSFESFRVTYDQARPTRIQPNPSPADTLTTAELRQRYEAMRAGQIEQTTFQATQRLVKHGLLLFVATLLFVTHWRWVQRQREPGAHADDSSTRTIVP